MKRRNSLSPIVLDRASSDPLHRQLAAALRRAIRMGELPPGAAAPSTRALALTLGLSRNTVLTAYDELAAEGLLVARIGSATRVSAGGRPLATPDWGALLRGAQYPADTFPLRDPDGNTLYFHR